MTVEEIIASLTPHQVFQCLGDDDPQDWVFWNLLDPNGLTIDRFDEVLAAMNVIFEREVREGRLAEGLAYLEGC